MRGCRQVECDLRARFRLQDLLPIRMQANAARQRKRARRSRSTGASRFLRGTVAIRAQRAVERDLRARFRLQDLLPIRTQANAARPAKRARRSRSTARYIPIFFVMRATLVPGFRRNG